MESSIEETIDSLEDTDYDRADPNHFLNTAYISISTMGFVGNLYAFYFIFNVLKKDFVRPTKNSNFVLGLLFMSIIDCISLMVIPMLVIDSYGFDWQFGILGCKVFWTIEHANKMGSRPFLAIISIERAVILKRPKWLKFFTLRRSIVFYFAVVLYIILPVVPAFYYSQSVRYDFIYGGAQYNVTTIDRCKPLYPKEHMVNPIHYFCSLLVFCFQPVLFLLLIVLSFILLLL